jgi:hypothetical protein
MDPDPQCTLDVQFWFSKFFLNYQFKPGFGSASESVPRFRLRKNFKTWHFFVNLVKKFFWKSFEYRYRVISSIWWDMRLFLVSGIQPDIRQVHKYGIRLDTRYLKSPYYAAGYPVHSYLQPSYPVLVVHKCFRRRSGMINWLLTSHDSYSSKFEPLKCPIARNTVCR